MDATIPVPVGGWNARDSFDIMPPQDAVQLLNVIPRETAIESRKGYTELGESGGGEPVETLVSYQGETSSELILSESGDVQKINTSTGVATSLGSGFTNDRWQTLNINNKLVMVNGQDAPQQYDGTTLSAMTISGPTVANLDGVTSFKGRAVYWEQGSQSFWHAAAGAYAGVLTEFPIDFVAQDGGGIMEIVTWSRDGGDGMDDLFVIVMESGETIVYQGQDFASDFSSIGRFKLGSPVSIRGSTNLGGDRIILTEDGYINLSTALTKSRANQSGNVGDKILNVAKSKIASHGSNYGWEVTFLPSQSLLIVNVPLSIDSTNEDNNVYRQHVMNTNTGAWCQFTDWQAVTFCEHDGLVYFGSSDGFVYQCFVGANDNGDYIYSKIIPAFNGFGMPANNKQPTLCTVMTDFHAPSYISCEIQEDFTIDVSDSAVRLPNESTGSLWGASKWGAFKWGQLATLGNEKVKIQNIPVCGYGYYLTIKIRHASKEQTVRYFNFNLKLKKGGTI